MTYATKKVCVIFIIKENDKYLFLKREYTGALDGYYMFPAGHVDDGESVLHAAARELKEELNIFVNPDDFVFKLVKPTNTHINLYFEVRRYNGTLQNMEPHKHADFAFLSLNHPEIHPLCLAEIQAINTNQLFLSEDEPCEKAHALF